MRNGLSLVEKDVARGLEIDDDNKSSGGRQASQRPPDARIVGTGQHHDGVGGQHRGVIQLVGLPTRDVALTRVRGPHDRLVGKSRQELGFQSVEDVGIERRVVQTEEHDALRRRVTLPNLSQHQGRDAEEHPADAHGPVEGHAERHQHQCRHDERADRRGHHHPQRDVRLADP